jgi:DDE superfamily endonuclease
MLRYENLKTNPRRFLALTGLTPREFQALLPAFTRSLEQGAARSRTAGLKKRKRSPGAGRRAVLATREAQLLFILVYLKTYALQVVHGELFGLSQSQTNYWIHQLIPALQAALDDLGVRPERAGQHVAAHERRRTDRRELIIDGTDRRRQRPKNAEKQALHYTGKRKTHTDKNVLVVTRATKRIAFLSATVAGSTSDKKVAEQAQISYPRGTRLRKDLGFQGYEPRGARTYQPKKSRKVAR